MGNTDSLPVNSQVKSAVQAISGDTEGARRTQENFLNTCPVVSQGKSLVHAIQGDTKAAEETQMKFLKNTESLVDGLPVFGHVKGGIHYAFGDKQRGDECMKSASRTVGVLGGGAVGMVCGGPVGAVAGGISGGAAVDGITTEVESAVEGKYMPNGVVKSVDRIVNNEADSGEIFDLGFGLAMDGVTGHAVGKVFKKGQKKQLYRVDEEARIDQNVKNQKIEGAPGQQKKATGEVWFAEDVEHQKGFLKDRRENGQGKQFECHQVETKKKNFKNTIDDNTIDQRGSKKINQKRIQDGENPYNLKNYERMDKNSKQVGNYGIKQANLDSFNSIVTKIKKIDLNSWKYKNGFTRFLSRSQRAILSYMLSIEGDISSYQELFERVFEEFADFSQENILAQIDDIVDIVENQ